MSPRHNGHNTAGARAGEILVMTHACSVERSSGSTTAMSRHPYRAHLVDHQLRVALGDDVLDAKIEGHLWGGGGGGPGGERRGSGLPGPHERMQCGATSMAPQHGLAQVQPALVAGWHARTHTCQEALVPAADGVL